MEQNNKVIMYEKIIKQKDQKINELQNMINNERIKIKYYETKIDNIYNQYYKFQEYKEALKDNIKFLQENLINKQEKIVELENINRAKEGQIISLKQIIAEKENRIEDLNSIQVLDEPKETESLLKRIFSNKNTY